MDAIQALLLQLKQNYIAELPDRFDQLEAIALQIENEGFSLERYNEFYRLVHSLKGSGGSYGLQIIGSVCHPLEDYLNTINPKSNLRQIGFGNIALAYIDLLREIGNRLLSQHANFQDIEGILAQLSQRAFAPRYSALLIENSVVVIKILRQNLVPFNFRVAIEDDGYLALGRTLIEPFDLIISAVEVKQLNGFAFMAALKLSRCINCNSPSILLTSNVSSDKTLASSDFFLIKDDKLASNFQNSLEIIVKKLELRPTQPGVRPS